MRHIRRPAPPAPRSRENLNASVFTLRVIVNVKHKDSSKPSDSSQSSSSGRVFEEGYQCPAYHTTEPAIALRSALRPLLDPVDRHFGQRTSPYYPPSKPEIVAISSGNQQSPGLIADRTMKEGR
jgi:hypothetical protein